MVCKFPLKYKHISKRVGISESNFFSHKKIPEYLLPFLHWDRIPVWTMPDIAIAHRIPVVLQPEMSSLPLSSSNFHVVLDEDPIMKNRVSASTNVCTFFILNWSVNNDIVSLPNTWCTAGINKGRVAVVNRSGLPMGIG
jgi:hypothetical protein